LSQFFFSSRRRHTRFSRDWSSDVCSSDLEFRLGGLCHATPDGQLYGVIEHAECTDDDDIENHAFAVRLIDQPFSIRFRAEGDRRSEERRVGSESISPWAL